MSVQAAAANNNQPVQYTPQANDPVVTQTVDRIETLLDSDGAFQWVSSDEVTDAANLIAGLPPEQADAVVDEMAAKGLLDTFAQEMLDTNWVGGGLSASDRAQVMTNMARQLDASSLATFTQALSTTGGVTAGHAPIAELGAAVATHTANPDVKLAFVEALAPHATDLREHDKAGAGADDILYSDPEAFAIAQVIGSFGTGQGASADHAQRAFETVQQSGALSAVMEASVQKNYRFASGPMGGAGVTIADTSTYNSLMQAAALIPSAAAYPTDPNSAAALKADIFSEAVALNTSFLPQYMTGERDVLRSGATNLLQSDPAGVIGFMANNAANTAFQNGSVLATHFKDMIESGETAQMGQLYADTMLQQPAPGVANDPGLWMSQGYDVRNGQPVTDPADFNQHTRFPVASTGGYFTGAVYAASGAVTRDQEQRAAIAQSFAEAGFAAIGASDRAGNPAAAAALSLAKDGVKAGLHALIVTEDSRQYDALYYGGIPLDTNGNVAIGDAVLSSYRDTYEEVKTFAKPE